jgi:hypothetical protein
LPDPLPSRKGRGCCRSPELALTTAKLRSRESRNYRLSVLPTDGEDETSVRAPELLTVKEAAVLLRVERKWVYGHARELGGLRLLGDRGPWRSRRRDLLARRDQPDLAPVHRICPRRPRPRGDRAGTPNGAPIKR